MCHCLLSECQWTDKGLCLLSDLMSCVWYSEFLQSDRPQGNRKINIFTWFPWSSRLVMEIKLCTPNAFCSWRSVPLNLCLFCYFIKTTKTCSTCRFRRPRLLLIHCKCEQACYISSVVICLLISWRLRENQTQTILIILLEHCWLLIPCISCWPWDIL